VRRSKESLYIGYKVAQVVCKVEGSEYLVEGVDSKGAEDGVAKNSLIVEHCDVIETIPLLMSLPMTVASFEHINVSKVAM
jgi:hypothetical protein